MKTNWENEIQKDLRDAGRNLKLSQECQHFNGAMAGVVNRYKNEMTAGRLGYIMSICVRRSFQIRMVSSSLFSLIRMMART